MIDKINITVKAGNGGDGALSFRREKYVPKGGPDGGDGGEGGDVILQATYDDNTLLKYRYKKNFKAQDGGRGMGKKKSGRAGLQLILKVPVGTVITVTNTPHPQVFDLKTENQSVLIAKGGRGGRGNTRFKTSTNRAPQQFERGEQGEYREVELELKLLADIGIIGLPNVGKSSLLSKLTNAHPKIADYHFTTLEPNLGVTEHGTVLADIPGLIKDASKGKGLGYQFLQHIERTKCLIHVIAPEKGEVNDPVPYLLSTFDVINKELTQYDNSSEDGTSSHKRELLAADNPDLDEKKQLVVLNKIDLLSDEKVEEVVKAFKKIKIKVIPVSCNSKSGLVALKKEIKKLVKSS